MIPAAIEVGNVRKATIFASVVLAIALVVRLGGFASGQTANEAAQRFIGMWRLVSITTNGHVDPDRGPHPTGFIVYDKSFNMAVQIMPDRERPKFAAAQPTPDEAKAARIGYAAYFGTYTVDGAGRHCDASPPGQYPHECSCGCGTAL
jgi:hypothetical protein